MTGYLLMLAAPPAVVAAWAGALFLGHRIVYGEWPR